MKSVVICGSRRFKPAMREFIDDELCHDVLYREIITNPEDLLKKL